jgi:hydrogenase maturation protease
MTCPRPIRVIGVGSPFGDDAVAWHVVDRLEESLKHEVEFHRVGGGQRLLEILDGEGTLVLIDALAPGTTPGTIRRFEWPDANLLALRPGTTHDMNPLDALKLAGILGIQPARVVVFGIEARVAAAGEGLSETVAAAVPALVDRIRGELTNKPGESLHA